MHDDKVSTNLKFITITGVKWATASQVGRQCIQLLTIVLLARLLKPSDFGLVGMSTVITGFIAIFKDLGTSAAIIQKKEISDELLSSVFWVNVGFGLLAMTVLFLAAPLGGAFYHDSQVTNILRVLSVGFLISSFAILQQALLERVLSFQLLAKLEIISVLSGAVVGILLAYYGAGIWSLVCQALMTSAVATVLLWNASGWRPRWIFCWSDILSVSNFSLYLTGFGLINYLIRNADSLLIGRYLGSEALGFYSLAYKILLFPIQNISAVISRATFPSFSAIQDDKQRFKNAYLQMSAIIALVSFPLMAGVIAVAKPFVMTVFGDAWYPLIVLITILAPIGLVQSVISPVGQIYMSMARTDLMLWLGVITGLIIVSSFVLGLQWGVEGVAISYAIATFLLIKVELSVPFRLINLKILEFMRVIVRPLITSLIMLVLVFILSKEITDWMPNAVGLIVEIIFGVGIYLLLSWLICRDLLIKFFSYLNMNIA